MPRGDIATIRWDQEPGSPFQGELYLHLHGPDAVWSEKAAWLVRMFERWEQGDRSAQWGPVQWLEYKREMRLELPGAVA